MVLFLFLFFSTVDKFFFSTLIIFTFLRFNLVLDLWDDRREEQRLVHRVGWISLLFPADIQPCNEKYICRRKKGKDRGHITISRGIAWERSSLRPRVSGSPLYSMYKNAHSFPTVQTFQVRFRELQTFWWSITYYTQTRVRIRTVNLPILSGRVTNAAFVIPHANWARPLPYCRFTTSYIAAAHDHVTTFILLYLPIAFYFVEILAVLAKRFADSRAEKLL